MGKSDYKKVKNKDVWVQDEVRTKNLYCRSIEMIRWAKRYLNRAKRRRDKQQLRGECDDC